MMHTTQTLYDELRSTLGMIDTQIKHIKNDIAMSYPPEMREKLNVWYWTKGQDGAYILEDMLAARARVLAAMAELKAADMNQKQPRR